MTISWIVLLLKPAVIVLML